MQPRIVIEWVLLPLVIASTAAAQDGGRFFDDNCAMCHAIGGEPGGAPDLKGVAARRDRQWLLRFIRDPEEAAEHDRDAAALVKEYDNGMPPTKGASRETIAAVLDYIDVKSREADAAPAASPDAPAERAITAADLALGGELFAGRRALANGGPPCASCHQLDAMTDVSGGALGPDLSGTHQRLGGTRALTAWIGNPPTPVMRAIYRKTPLTPDEAHAFVAVLAQGGRQPVPPSRRAVLLAAAIAGVAIVLVCFSVLWAGRFRGVRRAMIARAHAAGGGR